MKRIRAQVMNRKMEAREPYTEDFQNSGRNLTNTMVKTIQHTKQNTAPGSWLFRLRFPPGSHVYIPRMKKTAATADMTPEQLAEKIIPKSVFSDAERAQMQKEALGQ